MQTKKYGMYFNICKKPFDLTLEEVAALPYDLNFVKDPSCIA
jgi:hypothetical protein